MKRLNSIGFLALAGLLVVGCNDTETGAQGKVLYTPDNCDRVGGGCDFDRGIAVGGRVDVSIRAAESGGSTAGFDLESDDPSVFTVTPVADVGGSPRWEILGTGEGAANLFAVDSDGNDVDFLSIGVQELDGLQLNAFIGNAVGPSSDQDFDEIWQINADEEVSFFVEPTIGTGGDVLMGRLEFGVDADDLVPFLDETSDPNGGYYRFNVPAGDYGLFITADNGAPLDVLFQAQAAQ